MEIIKSWLRQLQIQGLPVVESIIAYIPNLLGAAVLLALGWFVAGFMRSACLKLAQGVDRLLDPLFNRRRVPKLKASHPVLDLFSKIVFWVVVLFFAKFALHTLGLEAVSEWMDQVVEYLPTFIAGGIILVAGTLFSVLIRDVTITTADSAGIPQARLFGTIAQGATLITTLVIGLDQIGIDVSFLANLIEIAVGALLGSLALAFGIGGRTFIGNLIGAHWVQKEYQPGQRVRIGGHEGVILEFTPTAVIVATNDGRLMIPASRFEEEASEQLIAKDGDD